ncbi:SLAC1 family transporter [Pedobacter agri]|uniref:SLAC1 family transporter n=1 Tax=Pedobacter agri TaxID=454586 RepID=UPI00292ED887|nr:hypothetical protein [Pedobacter agri]
MLTLDDKRRSVIDPVHSNELAIKYLPVGLFGATVALAGLGVALKQFAILYGFSAIYGSAVAVFGWVVFIILTMAYLIKYIMYPEAVKSELAHPVSGNFLGTLFISAVLLAGLAVPFSLVFARITWIAGTVGGLVFIYILSSRLYKGALNVLDAAPPTLIPGLTTLNAATAGVTMKFGWFGNEVDVILFSVGIAYVFVFFVVITYRLVHRPPVIQFLIPTLLLMSAPFTVGFICYLTIVPKVDLFGVVIFYFGFFIYAVLFFSVFKKGLPFMVSWWGACFSTGALANAALRYANLSHDIVVKNIVTMLVILLIILIAITLYHTISKLLRKQLFTPVK